MNDSGETIITSERAAEMLGTSIENLFEWAEQVGIRPHYQTWVVGKNRVSLWTIEQVSQIAERNRAVSRR